MNNFAEVLEEEGRYAEAETLLRDLRDIQRRVLGPAHPHTLNSMTNLADALMHNGQYAEADKLLRETLDVQRRVLGPDHMDTAATTYSLARVAAKKGEIEKALALLREAVDHGLEQRTMLGIETDPDFKPLQPNPRFTALLAEARQRAAAIAQQK